MAKSDLLPFEHGQDGTHGACDEMIKKLGGAVGCCTCNKHDCKDTLPTPRLVTDKERADTMEFVRKANAVNSGDNWKEEENV